MLSRKADITKTIAEQRHAAGPVVGQQVRQVVGDVALLELVGEHLEADQQQQQVGDDHPFVLEVEQQAPAPRPVGKAVTSAS